MALCFLRKIICNHPLGCREFGIVSSTNAFLRQSRGTSTAIKYDDRLSNRKSEDRNTGDAMQVQWMARLGLPTVEKQSVKPPPRKLVGKMCADTVVIDPEESSKWDKAVVNDDPIDSRTLSVAIVGAPNAGKSTLLNALVESKVSAVSPKYNTTREQIVGIRTQDDVQPAKRVVLKRRFMLRASFVCVGEGTVGGGGYNYNLIRSA